MNIRISLKLIFKELAKIYVVLIFFTKCWLLC